MDNNVFKRKILNARNWILLVITFLGKNEVSFANTCLKPQLELLVTPPDADLGNNIRIYWSFNRTYDGLWIGLYSDEPKQSSDEFLVANKIQVKELTGFETTGFFEVSDVKNMTYDQQTYLGYTAVAWTVVDGKDRAIVITKLQTYPQWMNHYWEFIKNVPMTDLFIPGTHDTCSYKGDPPQESDAFVKKHWAILKSVPLLDNWSLTQNREIKGQLVSGIRYLDIRVKREDDMYWSCHNSIPMHPLNQIIEQVVEFIVNTEKEIVVFDIHMLVSGIDSNEEKDAFVSYLKQSFTFNNKQLYVPPSKVNQLWKATPELILAEGRVIISFIDPDYQKSNNMDILWPMVFQYWGNKQYVNDLRDYIYATIPTRKASENMLDTLTSVMAELTANLKRIAKDRKNDLSAQSEQHSIEIHSWFMDPAVALQTNVLAVDFFTIYGVARLAFIWNERKYYKSTCDSQQTIADDYYQKVIIP
uniref:Phosphatidylinositol-specific phospholipase C X domain-containing protein 1 n=1 Tax=Nilaparvata lugens TaxID=108931 RepID=A0A191UR72_NILLU|nr:phosphatidylinositol-specific phospholipase C X domain-containing protein 1 [Nilaparvata lugens]